MDPDLKKIKEEIDENNKRKLVELQKFNQEMKKLRKSSKQDAPQFMIDDLIRLKTEPIVKKKRYGSVKEYKEKEGKDDFPPNLDSKDPAVTLCLIDYLFLLFF